MWTFSLDISEIVWYTGFALFVSVLSYKTIEDWWNARNR